MLSKSKKHFLTICNPDIQKFMGRNNFCEVVFLVGVHKGSTFTSFWSSRRVSEGKEKKWISLSRHDQIHSFSFFFNKVSWFLYLLSIPPPAPSPSLSFSSFFLLQVWLILFFHRKPSTTAPTRYLNICSSYTFLFLFLLLFLLIPYHPHNSLIPPSAVL